MDRRGRRPGGDAARRLPPAGGLELASDTAMAVTTDAVQLLGSYGYTRDFPVERMMRDAKITQIYEGTNQIQPLVMARQLLKGRWWAADLRFLGTVSRETGRQAIESGGRLSCPIYQIHASYFPSFPDPVLTLAPGGTPIRLVRVLKNGAWQYPVLDPGMACCLDGRR